MRQVSVIMSTFNEKKEYLTEAIESVRNQSFSDFEFIIILDNPKNEMIRQCVESYARIDGRIRIIANEKNMGLTKSLNSGIKVANGKYMSRMDADDIMMPTCLELELEMMKQEQLALVAVSKKNIDEFGNVLGTYVNDLSPAQLEKLLPYENSINHPAVMVKMDVVRELKGYRDIPSCEDYDLWLRMLYSGYRMRILPDILLLYRVRADGICGNNPYQVYKSSTFVQRQCRRGAEHLGYDENEHKKVVNYYDVTAEKTQRFNHAFEMLHKGGGLPGQRVLREFVKYFYKSIRIDYEIIFYVCKKIKYSIRKRYVLRFVR